MKGGDSSSSIIKHIKQLQRKRSVLEKNLLSARGNEVKDLKHRIDGLTGVLQRIKSGGCGSCGVTKYQPTRGGSAPLDYKMAMGYHHDNSRSTNHTTGGKRKRRSRKKTGSKKKVSKKKVLKKRKSSKKKRSRKK